MCLDDQVLTTFIDGELAEPWKTQAEEHLLHCTSCKTRYNQLLELEKGIQHARLRDEEISFQKDRVWQFLEKNCVTSVKERFLERRFTLKAPVMVAAAAVFVLFFAVNIFIATRPGSLGDDAMIPEIGSTEVNTDPVVNPMVKVRATDSAPVARSIEDISIEEILQLLDARGFEVDLRLKSLSPLTAAFDPETLTLRGVDGVQNPIDPVNGVVTTDPQSSAGDAVPVDPSEDGSVDGESVETPDVGASPADTQ